MFSKKLTDKSIMAACILLGVVILLLVYFVPFTNTKDEINQYEAKNASLQATLNSLRVYYDNRNTYIQETAELQKEIQVLANAYPSGYRPEDYIMEAVKIESIADDIIFEEIKIEDADSIALIDAQTVAGANIENLTQQIEFIEQDVVYQTIVDYTSLKQSLAEVLSSPYCANIQSITYTTNKKTGKLEGDFTLGYFYVTGTGVEYIPPYINDYPQGTDNIFGKYESEEDIEDLGTTQIN